MIDWVNMLFGTHGYLNVTNKTERRVQPKISGEKPERQRPVSAV